MFRNVISLALVAFALAGCGRDEVKTYRVAKDESTAPQNQIAMPEQNASPQLQFALPSDWREKTPGQMRVASFAVTNASVQIADVGVIPLQAGENELDLVNMWREQMQLPALTNEITVETVFVGGESAKLFDIASEQPLIDGKFRARILIAELTRGNASWFFKMTGEDSFIASQKENFLQFLKSVSFAENSAAQISNAPMTQNQGAVSIWTIPSGWQRLPPSEFLVAKFLIQNGGAKAEVNVSSLAGEGGGLPANVNRWRGQLGLEPLKNEMELAHIVPAMDLPGGGHLTTVDFSGTDVKTGKPARLVGAIVPQSGRTWFYKLMGDEQIVAQQKDAFIEFIQSANYADAR
jgi:hypothetical protein